MTDYIYIYDLRRHLGFQRCSE